MAPERAKTECSGGPADLWLDRYMEGTLPEEEAEQFEEHYFECPVCLAQVQKLQALQQGLAERPRRTTQPIVKGWPVWVALGAGMAAMLTAGVVTWHNAGHAEQQPASPAAVVQQQTVPSPPVPTREPDLARLADLSLPPYPAAAQPAATVSPAYGAGMQRYIAGDCAASIAHLEQVPAGSRDRLAARFYIGVCQMRLADLSEAAKTLEPVAADRDSPLRLGALYYQGQIALAQNDFSEARAKLMPVAAQPGEFEQRARAEIGVIPAASGGK